MPTLVRPKRGRILAGVCAAIANRLGWSPTLIRVLWVVLSFIPGPLWVAYVVLWLMIPAEEDVRPL
ncbi:MAG: PspC family transcriptional regulator [Microbacteriaceae bacterium]|jgi:phage shock protein C|nr:PspC family transcriptional regulator [Microbacteriaceae bacterium]HEV7956838.1 PspC domain-containing protein [Marisediminicola sp.]